MKKQLIFFLTGIFLLTGWNASGQSGLVWTEKGKDFHDAIPLGNGDIGISAWMEQAGDLIFYIGKTDAYDDNNRLLKLGKVRVTISPNPFEGNNAYRQELKLREGEMEIQAGMGDDRVTMLLWVDANQPAIHLTIQGKKKFSTQVRLEDWRRQERTIIEDRAFSDPYPAIDDSDATYVPTIQYPDSILSKQTNRLVWFHHNTHSCWPYTLALQGLGTWMKGQTDPLLHRTFGGSITGEGLIQQNDTTLVSSKRVASQDLMIIVLTKKNVETKDWLKALDGKQMQLRKENARQDIAAHHVWWKQFWNRSWVKIQTQGDTGAIITRSYNLQRYLMACGGRGPGWAKFNGSIFTLPWKFNADYRDWGSAQWFQNARLLYWPMIASGDFDMMAPFYGTYLAALPLAKERTRIYYHHEGAFFSETSYAWDTYSNYDYGYNRDHLPVGFARSTYMRHYWSGGLELSTMMLEQYAVTQNKKFLTDTLLPLADAIVQFYDQHWKRDEQGKICFDTAQSLETWQTATNPLPIIAGLKYTLQGLSALPADLSTAARRKAWKKTLADLPDLPEKQNNGQTILLPAAVFGKKSNSENPELYAVFPYRIYGIGKDSLDIGIHTYAVRVNRENRCWWQDEIQAACLGLGREAANGIVKRMTNWNKDYRFPAMWGPNNDEIPDLDHGGVGDMAIQNMLLQSDKDRLFLFPAWPRSWNVSFKLHAAMGTIIEADLRDGKLQKLVVTPESRRKDIVIMPLQ
jgi:hypothetical protein